jgi:hypothetical protein
MAKRKAEDEDFENTAAALLIVHEDAERRGLGKGKGGIGEVDCPVPGCGGKIKYSVSSYNGHIAAACSRKGCQRWIE